ncbi:MAG: hypothetical protein ABEJ75_00495 [Candidatus Nanohaloarchaea archaeon]
MKLFDKINRDEETEEVAIRPSESSGGENRLEREAEARLTETDDSSDSTSEESGSSGSFLPGMDADTSSTESSESITREDIHEQNQKIIGLLEDIKSEMRGY